jgi:hypothetical protein
VQNTDIQSNTASAAGLPTEEKQRRKENREKFLDRIRDSLGNIKNQLAFSVPEAAIACGRSPTWAYRMIYREKFRVITEGGRLLIPRCEIEHFLAGATTYNPTEKEGKDNAGS